eukprot:366281-Chlamydomonas_euryale.AAC.15
MSVRARRPGSCLAAAVSHLQPLQARQRRERLDRRAARPQHRRRVTARVEHGRLDAASARPAVDHQRQPAAEVGHHVCRRCRRRAAAAIGAGCGERRACRIDECARNRVRRQPHRDCLQPGSHGEWHGCRPRQEDCQRAGPVRGDSRGVRLGKCPSGWVKRRQHVQGRHLRRCAAHVVRRVRGVRCSALGAEARKERN